MKPRPTDSLRRKLLTPLIWLWLFSSILATLVAFWFAGRATDSSFDRILKDDALALASQVHWQPQGPWFSVDSNTAASLIYDSLSPSLFMVANKEGHKLAGNADLTLPPGSEQRAHGVPLFFDARTTAGALRVVALRQLAPTGHDWVWVVVGEPKLKREQISSDLAQAIFYPAIALTFIIVPLLFVGVRFGLQPAQTLSDAITHRSIDDLSPLPLDQVPNELRGFIQHINELLARLQEAVTHERMFIADAAHQLRTPVAGIKLLTEDLIRTHRTHPRSPPDDEVLHELQAASSRATRLVRQLLTLARTQNPTAQSDPPQPVLSVLKAVERTWAPHVIEAGKTLDKGHWRIDPAALLPRSPLLLEEALGNLIDNAVLYGGPHLSLHAQTQGAELVVQVIDDGPGLSAQELAQMAQPFWRRPQDSRTSGSGLGLSIVLKACQELGGSLHLSSSPPGQGLCATVRIPVMHPMPSDSTGDLAPG